MPDLILGPGCWVLVSLGRRPVVLRAPAPDPDCLCPLCFDSVPALCVPVLPACLRGVGLYIEPPAGAPAGPLLPARAMQDAPPAPEPAPELLPSVSWFWFGPPAPRPRRAPRLRAGRARRR